MKEPRLLHYNIPQIKVMLAGAWENYLVMSRGTGKSSGILSPWLVHMGMVMPRSMGGIVGATFQQLLVRTLPPVISNWERMGYVRDKHYVIGREPTDAWKRMWAWKGPIVKPLDSTHAIYWFNGSVQVLISQDRIGSSNGLSLQYLGGDEAKLLNKDRLDDEVMPTMRGLRSHFGHLPEYRGKMFLTDMPTIAKAKWILDKALDMDQAQIELMMEVHGKICQKRNEWMRANDAAREVLEQEIAWYVKEFNRLRTGSIYYGEANVYDNIDVLGDDYVSDMRRNMSEAKFRAAILNERLTKIEGGFYGNLDPDQHAADWSNFGYLEGLIEDLQGTDQEADCRHDTGFNQSRPLEVAFDYGDNINCMVVGQEAGDEIRILNALYVLHPQLVSDLVDKFCRYYRFYQTKEVLYWYDHTAVGGIGTTAFTYETLVIESFRKNGWMVRPMYGGKAPNHDRKFDFWGILLGESDSRLPRFRYSRSNCQDLEASMLNAGVKRGRLGFEKDKTPERDKSVPAEEATHLSDACDTLIFFKYHHKLTDMGSFIPSSTS
jgi:hypothetical protein